MSRRQPEDDAFWRELKRLQPDVQNDDFEIRRYNRNVSLGRAGTKVSFWENGLCWHDADMKSPLAGARAAWSWCYERLNSRELERRFAGLTFPERRHRIEEGVAPFLEWHWQTQRSHALYQTFEQYLQRCPDEA